MLQYSGYRFDYGIKLIVIGDGESTSVAIDLRKEPFGINFQGFYPKSVMIRNADGEKPTGAIDASGVLTLTYKTPLGTPMGGSLTPRSQLDVFLLFAPSTEERS